MFVVLKRCMVLLNLHFRILLRVHDSCYGDTKVGRRAPEICVPEGMSAIVSSTYFNTSTSIRFFGAHIETTERGDSHFESHKDSLVRKVEHTGRAKVIQYFVGANFRINSFDCGSHLVESISVVTERSKTKRGEEIATKRATR